MVNKGKGSEFWIMKNSEFPETWQSGKPLNSITPTRFQPTRVYDGFVAFDLTEIKSNVELNRNFFTKQIHKDWPVTKGNFSL